MDDFYRHVTGIPVLAGLLGNDVTRLTSAQGNHWRKLFSGRFDDGYFASVRAIGLVHEKIGLEPRRYIGGYNFVLGRLTALAMKSHRWSSAKAAPLVAALLNMEIAVSVYHEKTMAERGLRERLEGLTQNVSGKVGHLVGLVSSAATELQATPQSMTGTADMTMQQASNVAKRTDTVVRALAEGARSIGEVVGLISNIAGQTNLLALNATNEAVAAMKAA